MVRFVIEGASPAFEEGLLALIAGHADGLTVQADREWTVDRARDFMRLASPAARTLIRDVLSGGGYRAAVDLRSMGRTLSGPSIAVTKAVTKGVTGGLWPTGMPAPITRDYGREKPQNKQVEGYRMAPDLVIVFTAATEG